ncbi:unnamed protein product [Rhizoctonia solani]|uniref:Uncharacterized protein n=1 Tax=Rhizoctonia solani TaxID=456999 RepID=A0A8H3B8Q5_9AGAM|nr:unnamed protein product [Rhizoctonia solani]
MGLWVTQEAANVAGTVDAAGFGKKVMGSGFEAFGGPRESGGVGSCDKWRGWRSCNQLS